MSENEAGKLRAQVEGIRDKQTADGINYLGVNTHYLFPTFYDLVQKKTVLDEIEKFLGPDILCWNAAFFNKEPFDRKFVTWHQDLTYWGLDPPDIISAWIALTPSIPENGCMRVVPGSHVKGQIDHVDSLAKNNILSRGQEIKVEVDEREAVDLVLQPGEMSLHHVLIIHGSRANSSNISRYGFVVRYIPTLCHQIGGRTEAMLVRGDDTYGHFYPVPRPQSDLHADVLAFWEQANEKLNRILFAGA